MGSRNNAAQKKEKNKMKKFNARFKIGTKVKLECLNGWQTIKSIDSTKKWIEIENYSGSFQRAHVLQFSNKK